MNEEPRTEALTEQTVGIAVATELKEIVEALLFASDEPVTLETLRIVFDDMNREKPDAEKIDPTGEEIREAINSLNAEYIELHRAYRIQQLAGGYVFATEKKFATWVGKLFKEKARRKLSQTAVETLAIIAYKQPITKSEVEFIRGVNADYIMKTLLEKNLAAIVGRAHSPGRPLLYGTTPDFLRHFGLNEISDLPKPREIEELLGETELEVEKRMLANQEEMEFKEKLHEKFDPNSRAPHIPRKKSKLQEEQKESEGKTVIEKTAPVLPSSNTLRNEDGEVIENKEVVPLSPPTQVIAAGLAEQTEASFAEEFPEIEAEPTERIAESTAINESEAILRIPPEEVHNEEILLVIPEIADNGEAGEAPVHGYVAPEETGSTETVELPLKPGEPERHESKKGWSTWKTKIQTFFRKLFG
ncbi:MAG: SMC-Scp complex subunit ScpB [Bacteroidota bacterium]